MARVVVLVVLMLLVVLPLLVGLMYQFDKHRALDDVRAEAGLEFVRLDRLTEHERSEAVIAGMVEGLVPSHRLLAIRLYRLDGRLAGAFDLNPAWPVTDVLPVASGRGERVDDQPPRFVMWQPVGSARYQAVLTYDLSPVVSTLRRDSVGHAMALGAVLLITLGVLPMLLLEPQVAVLRRITNSTQKDKQTWPWPWTGTRPPWWLAREVVELAMGVTALREATDRQVRQIRDSKQLLQWCGEANPNPVVVCDGRGRVKSANGAASRFLGLPPADLVGTSIEQFLPADRLTDLKAMLARLTHVAAPFVRHGLRGTVLLASGEPVPVEMTLAADRVGDEPVLCIYCHDLRQDESRTDLLRHALTQAEAVNTAKSRFLATVSHEISTPLNGLSGMLNLLDGTSLDDDQRELFDVARAATTQLRALLNDLLDLSKVEAGELNFENIPFDVREQLDNTLRTYAATAQHRGLTLGITWDLLGQQLLGDPYRIRQVLANLLDNALKFTAEGGVEVAVQSRLAKADTERIELKISVSDTGIGVPPDRVGVIFDAFSQAEDPSTRRFGGTGLGLSLSRRLCQHMGGGIRVSARPGGGSVFTFHVVCGVVPDAATIELAAPDENVWHLVLQGRRVLVVDDNRVNQTLLRRWLEREQMQVTVLGDGASAVRAVGEAEFDLVLMDVSMPGMNGLDATRAIRALARADGATDARLQNMPVIGVSAHAMKGDHENCLAAGMNDYVTKPIQREALLTKITRALTQAGVEQPAGSDGSQASE